MLLYPKYAVVPARFLLSSCSYSCTQVLHFYGVCLPRPQDKHQLELQAVGRIKQMLGEHTAAGA